MGRVIFIILGIVIPVIFIVLLLDKSKNKFYKFIPAIILTLLSLYFIIKSKYFAVEWQDLTYFIYFMFTVPAAIMSLFVALILNRKKK